MADSVDRVFGHALNTVNKIRLGSQKPPLADRQELYGLYKQSMEGDVAEVADRPTVATPGSVPNEQLRKEQEKWDAWKSNEGLTRTQAKRRYIEKLIDTMHKYASFTPEAQELVEELEFVWDQIKNNSQPSSSEHSSPVQRIDRSGYMQPGGSSSSAAMMDASRASAPQRRDGDELLSVLSPVSQAEEEELLEEERDEFVDAPISQVDDEELGEGGGFDGASIGDAGAYRDDAIRRTGLQPVSTGGVDRKWRRRIETSLIKLTTEVAALREQIESRRYFKLRDRYSVVGWVLRLGWWAVQLLVADAVLLWFLILYLRRRKDQRLEMAVRVLLGDAVAQVQKVGHQVKMPALPRLPSRKQG